MCRPGGRRCDTKWDDAHRERFNARRRVTRNSQKAAAARDAGNDAKAAQYDTLVVDAKAATAYYDHLIESHEVGDITVPVADTTQADADLAALRDILDEGSPSGATQCPDCGQFAAAGHDCPRTLSTTVLRDADGAPAVFHHGSSVQIDDWDPEFTNTGNDTWGSGFYFTSDESRAHGYGEHVRSIHLEITNPIYIDGIEHAGIDSAVQPFTHDQVATILKAHPGAYSNPGDEDNTNILEDYSPEFWDREEWTRDEMDQMLAATVRDNFPEETPWSSVESMFPAGAGSDEFRRAVREVTGHDGVVVDFGDEGSHAVAWFPEQVLDAPSADMAQGGAQEQCPTCGRWTSAGHACPQTETLEVLRATSEGWREGWSDDESFAFDMFGGVQHYDINAKLRSGAALDDDEEQIVESLDAALARAPQLDEERTLYRAFGLSEGRGDAPVGEWVDAHFPAGADVTFDAFTSATPDRSVADYFSERGSLATQSGVFIEMETRQGGYTGESAEQEVLLRRGSRFEVVSSDEEFEMEGKPFRRVVLRERP